MADNVAITAGSGTTISSDDIGGVQYPRVKIMQGADGEATDIDFGQATMANSLPVVIASNQSAVPVSRASLPALAAGDSNIGNVDVLTIAAGDNNIGNVDIARTANRQ